MEREREEESGRKIQRGRRVCVYMKKWREKEERRWRGKWKIGRVGEGERERERLNTLQLCLEFLRTFFAGSDFRKLLQLQLVLL